ncbi:MAG: stage II sporulation protein M [Verrucomicrobiota bacterium]
MIIDLPRFLATEQPFWAELEKILDRLQSHSREPLPLEDAKRFHFLYQKVSADLGRITTFASEPALRSYLEALTARAYSEIHETRSSNTRFRPFHWFFREFPRVFRKHRHAFYLSLIITLIGCLFGGLATLLDPEAKSVILPEMFSPLLSDPSERVAMEEKTSGGTSSGEHSVFASELMVNNISVSIKALAFGMTYAFGTIILLFYNGVILGLVALDYIRAGQTIFLLGWLLPHGVIEIPAILIAGQGGLALGQTLIGRGDRTPLTTRLRTLGPDLTTLIGGVAVLLVWAGLIESFFSQYHSPVIPYSLKISFGFIELICLICLLCSGTEKAPTNSTPIVDKSTP